MRFVQLKHYRLVVCFALTALISVGCGKQQDRMTAARQEDSTANKSVPDSNVGTSPAPSQAETIETRERAREQSNASAAEIAESAAPSMSLTEAGESTDAFHQHAEAAVSAAPTLKTRSPSALRSAAPPTTSQPSIGSLMLPDAAASVSEASAGEASASETNGPFAHLPAGATREAGQGFATIKVFYATDRAQGSLPLSAYEITGQHRLFKLLCVGCVSLFLISAISWICRRPRLGTLTTLCGTAAAVGAGFFVAMGHAGIEKHGVTYGVDRGLLTRGICEVTVPDVHQRGQVERPSLLRFEFREDQKEHIVLTRAVELPQSEFLKRLSDTVSSTVDQDLLVFIHGYNVDFQSAVQRTAQVAVDLPFEGVPVCYSWPSQGKLLGYSIDENNSQWTVTHLKEFLLELANESGAKSINVVAHSMGNRAMTAAMQKIHWELGPQSDPVFDRVVLAAPDVDAEIFRKDLAPSLLNVANQITLYASSDDQALIASKRVHGYPRAGESGRDLVVVPGIETVDVSGIDLSLLGHSYYGDNESMLRDLYQVVRSRLPAPRRGSLIPRQTGNLIYWQLAQKPSSGSSIR